MALLGFFSFFLRIVDGGAIHFDPGDEEQPAFEACVGLALFLAFLVDEGIRPDIADTEGNQNLPALTVMPMMTLTVSSSRTDRNAAAR